MKWIGQLIYDQIARFRDDVYLEDISTGTIASGGHLGLDSNNKIVKAVDGGGDLTGITAGTGLSGTDLTGPVPTLNVDAAQTQITSLGTLTSLAVDDISLNGKVITITGDTDDKLEITTGTHGATTIATTDDAATAGNLLLDIDGTIDLDAANGGKIEFSNAGTTYADFSVHHSTSALRMFENGGASTNDYFDIAVAANGSTTLKTEDDAAAAAHFSIAADGNITLDAAGDIAFECGGGDLTCDADTVTFSSANADDPQFIIKNTTADNQGARFQLRKDRNAAMVDNDRIGEVDFIGEDASQNTQQYAKIFVQASETAHGTETGKMTIQVAEYDGTNTNGLVLAGQDADGEIDVTIGAGAASTTTIAGTLTMGSTATLTNAGLVAVANQSNITGVGTISSGTWQGTAIASAYLDADTVHYSAIRQFTHHMMTDNIGTSPKVYVALQETDAEATTSTNKNLPFLAPGPGKLLKVLCRTGGDCSGATFTWRLETTNVSTNTASAPSIIGTQSGTGPTAKTMTTYDFTSSLDSGTNVIAEGDTIQLSIQADASTGNFKYYITCIWEFDIS